MNLALFDFDGTITTKDTFVPFLRFAVEPSRFTLGAILASPAAVGYRLGLVAARHVRPVVARLGFQGACAERVRARGRTYAEEVLPHCVREAAADRIRWHQRRNDVVVVVSAGLDVYLEAWCRAHGLECICTELDERNGRLTGRYRGGDCCGEAKARRVSQRFELARFANVYAYGDSPEDHALLRLANRRFYRWKECRDEMSPGEPGSSVGWARERSRGRR